MQGFHLLLAGLLLVLVAGVAVALVLFLSRREKTNLSDHPPVDEGEAAQPDSEGGHWVVIVDRLDSIERTIGMHVDRISADLMESVEWQALARQFDTLLDQQVDHLRALSSGAGHPLTIQQALHHTVETYRLSLLISALYDRFVGDSDVVPIVLDEWFQQHRATTTSRIRTKLQLDCARVLLIDLDYAHPSAETARAQLELAEKHRSAVCPARGDTDDSCSVLKSEIALRMDRLSERLPPEKRTT